MHPSLKTRSGAFVMVSALALFFAGCGNSDGTGDGQNGAFDNNPPLSELPPLLEGWPGNNKLADEGKADATYPKLFDAPYQWQSPIKSQGSRGVCSIFSAVGLMEHLYRKEGTVSSPDFSEQFLQWSVKSELGQFKNTSGSNSNYNLQAINRFGIVEEALDPYETFEWTSTNDAACTGDSDERPVQCHTNGDPSEEALAGKRWHLPPGRWVSSRRDSIKAHMVANETAVVVGGTFYYQSWNHRSSKLTVNSDYFANGYVTYPNEEDKADSKLRPAGHSFLLIGWNDDLEVQKRNGAGELLTDADGNPDMEKGFFLFRNSWGTGSFGTKNTYGAGYGYISMKYVEELTAYVSSEPEVDLGEDCNDDVDNDFDNAIDCDDSDCASDAACDAGGTQTHTFGQSTAIPDSNTAGVEMDLDVQQAGTVAGISLTVDISHTYIGDLKVVLMRDGTDAVVLHDGQGAGDDDIRKTFSVGDYNGMSASAVYTLHVIDSANQDVGTVNSWSLEIKTGEGGGGGSSTEVYASTEDVAIPDNDTTGAFSNLEIDDRGDIKSMKATVEIDHPYQGDLTVKLQRLGMPGEATLVEANAASGQFGTKSFVVSEFLGEDAQGTWRLVVTDEAGSDEGSILGWSLEVTY